MVLGVLLGTKVAVGIGDGNCDVEGYAEGEVDGAEVPQTSTPHLWFSSLEKSPPFVTIMSSPNVILYWPFP